MIPPADYMRLHYTDDFKTFDSDMMCGISMAKALQNPMRAKMHGIREFTLSQFGLNLLNQAIYTHGSSYAYAWKNFSPRFADTHLCFSGHGMGSHVPHSILRFAQEPFSGREDTPPISLRWEEIDDYIRYFMVDLLAQFAGTEEGAGFSIAEFHTAVEGDYECTACRLASDGWQSRHVAQSFEV